VPRVAYLLLLLLLVRPTPARADAVSDTRVLAKHGLEAKAGSLRAYLRTLYPDGAARRQALLFAGRLGDEDAFRRDEAVQRLTAMGSQPIFALREAARSTDPETRRAARSLLEDAIQQVGNGLLRATLNTITRGRIAGLTQELLLVAPVAAEVSLLDLVHAALRAGARPEDTPMLLERARDPDSTVRAATVLALGTVLPADRLIGLEMFLASPEPRVRFSAALGFANRGRRECLPALVDLLDADELWLRLRAARALRHVSGTQMGYAAYAPLAERKKTVGAWRRWLEENKHKATWKVPLREGQPLLGRTLISFYGKGRAIEIDARGITRWSVAGLSNPWACVGLPNGNRLITEYGLKRITEYDATGRQVWRHAALPGYPGSVQRLPNGNILLAIWQPAKIIELARDGSTAWQLALQPADRPTDVELLDNGNLLITMSGSKRVVEMTRRGRLVWSIGGFKSPYSASRTATGTTLVVDFSGGEIREYNGEGKVVWKYGGLQNCYDAQRLPNGHTLVGDRRGLREIDHAGKTVWSYACQDYLRFHRY